MGWVPIWHTGSSALVSKKGACRTDLLPSFPRPRPQPSSHSHTALSHRASSAIVSVRVVHSGRWAVATSPWLCGGSLRVRGQRIPASGYVAWNPKKSDQHCPMGVSCHARANIRTACNVHSCRAGTRLVQPPIARCGSAFFSMQFAHHCPLSPTAPSFIYNMLGGPD